MLRLVVVVLQLVEPHSGIEFTLPSELRCVYIPEATLGAGCTPANPARLDAMRAEATFLLASNPDEGVVLIGRTIAAKSPSTMSDDDLDKFIRGIAEGLSSLGTFTPEEHGTKIHWILTYDGLKTASYAMTADFPTQAKAPNQASVVGVIIPTKTEIVSLMETAPERDGVIPKLLLSLKVPSSLRSNSMFGTGGAYRMGQLMGEAFCGLICAGGLFAVLWSVLRRRRKPAVAVQAAPREDASSAPPP